MLRGYIRSSAKGGAKAQEQALTEAGVTSIYRDGERDALIKSLRKNDGVAVVRLSCLGTNKADVRWALWGEDKRAGYQGIFIRGHFVRDLEHDAVHCNRKQVESVLAATEDWANERRAAPSPDARRRGLLGGRPKKRRTDKHEANKAWKDLVKFPRIADALASSHMKGWTQSAATRPIKAGGLGPRGALPGRLQKPKND